MPYSLLVDLVVLLHLLFVLFVVLGGLIVLRWPRLVWLHLPAALWGVVVECTAGLCPLTDLENHWRRLGGQAGYGGDFLQHYLQPVLYPPGLDPRCQFWLGWVVLLFNLAVYLFGMHRRRGWFRKRGGG